MAAAPLTPPPMPTPTPEAAGLSQGTRIIDTFIAPSKTFTDIRRSTAWWAPFLIMVLMSTIFVTVAGQKVGFRKAMENQMQSQPKAQARLDNLPADQREKQLDIGAKFTKVISYCFPIVILIILLIFSGLLFGTFKVAGAKNLTFSASLAVVMYASLPGAVRSLLATISLLAGGNVDSFTFQNPVATNAGYFMNAADNPFLYSLASSLDIFQIWSLVLMGIGFSCVTKMKSGTSFAIVTGWWLLFVLGGAALAGAS
jgi:Yip1 domain